MTASTLMDDAQLRQIVAAIRGLKDGGSLWRHFLISAAPVFFGAVLGLAFGFFADWLKTRRENRKISRAKREEELAQLNGIMTALGFNVESLTHTVMQQVMPHYDQSHAAIDAIQAVRDGKMTLQQFDELLHSDFMPAMTRCPDPYFIEVELFRAAPFVIAHDPNLLKLSAWIPTYIRDLRYILSERNKMIDLTTLGQASLDGATIERSMHTQASVANAEVVNSFQLFQQLLSVSERLEVIIKSDYGDMPGRKLRIQPPDALKDTLARLEHITKSVVPDLPPPQPPSG